MTHIYHSTHIEFTENGCDVVTVVPSEDQSHYEASHPYGTTSEVGTDDVPVEDI